MVSKLFFERCEEDLLPYEKTMVVAIRSLASLALGGASGAALPYITAKLATASDGVKTGVDGHVVAMVALFGGLTALLGHWAKPPYAGINPPIPPETK